MLLSNKNQERDTDKLTKDKEETVKLITVQDVLAPKAKNIVWLSSEQLEYICEPEKNKSTVLCLIISKLKNELLEYLNKAPNCEKLVSNITIKALNGGDSKGLSALLLLKQR